MFITEEILSELFSKSKSKFFFISGVQSWLICHLERANALAYVPIVFPVSILVFLDYSGLLTCRL